jgi:superoxide dismutase
MLFRSRTQMGPARVLGESPQAEPKSKRQSAMEHSRNLHPSLLNSQQPSSPGSGTKLGQGFKPPRAGGSGSPPARQISTAFQDLVNSRTRSDRLPLTGKPLIPLLACSVHEHCWLQDHGIWGKEEYMSNFWEVVDWRKVGMTYENKTGGYRF